MISGIWKTKASDFVLTYLAKDPENMQLVDEVAVIVHTGLAKEGYTGSHDEVLDYIRGPMIKGKQVDVDPEDSDYIGFPESKNASEFDFSAAADSEWKAKYDGLKSTNDSLQGENQKLIANLDALETENNNVKEQLASATGKIIEVKVKRGPKIVKKIKAVFHKEFHRVLSLCQSGKNVMLYGPTGTGKTKLGMMLAEALDARKFGFISCTSGMSESKITCSLLPTGASGKFEPQISEFIDIFENGGLFLFDEMDRADPNVLMIINAALANGVVPLPARKKKPYAEDHPDFMCICATNTVGTGGDRVYTAANKLDMATLNRFWKVKIDYDKNVETQLVEDQELLNYCWAIRDAIEEHKLEQAMSTRYILEAHELKNNGHGYEWSQKELDIAYFAGWPRTQFDKVVATMRRKGITCAVKWEDLEALS